MTFIQVSKYLAVGVLLNAALFVSGVWSDETKPSLPTSDGTGRIVILEAGTDLPKPPDFYTANAAANVQVGTDRIQQQIRVDVQIIQGDSKTVSFGLNGDGQVTSVVGDKVVSWSVRIEDDKRFLDIHPAKGTEQLAATVSIRSREIELPAQVELAHLSPGESVGFNATVSIQYASGVSGKVSSVEGFVPLRNKQASSQFQTASGGTIELTLSRDGAAPGPIELTDTSLQGELHENNNSVSFEFRGNAHVTEPGAEVTILSGNAAVNLLLKSDSYRLELRQEEGSLVYKLIFPKAGTFPITFSFVAKLLGQHANWHGTDFTVATGAVVPLTIRGLADNLTFQRDRDSIVPVRDKENWVGFLPATGRARLLWKKARKAGAGKLFFTTTARVEAELGAGLLRQEHLLSYQVLQGELPSVTMELDGPGEILDVQGANIVSWHVSGEGDDRKLDVTLSQPISSGGQIKVLSQTAVGAFPVRIEGLRLSPTGAIRHSGHLRLTNSGSVRLEPTGLAGLTQLAPEQFPGEARKARQVLVYRFPSADHEFTILADRIQPEVNIAELVIYELAETDRTIKADVELDIREAPIREWDFRVPSDYSVVSVTGSSVADYVSATEVTDGRRNLKVIFSEAIAGRQLVTVHLEKNELAAAGEWVLPKIEYPEAKTIRGDLGVVGAPGFRIAIGATTQLLEKPLSYFTKPSPNLQQAFRIREPDWTATMQIEKLEGSIQADVFHLYSLSQETIYGSSLINYFVTGAPVSEWQIDVPAALGNVMVDGQDVRTWRREGDKLIVSLHQPVMGAYTLLVTFEEKPSGNQATFQAGQVTPLEVTGERGYIQVVSPMQVDMQTLTSSDTLLKLDPLELPAEFRLLSTAPPLGTWQYTERPFDLGLQVGWFQPGETVAQVVEFSEASSRVSKDGELVTDVLYYVKSRGQRTLRVKLPDAPVRLWEVSVNDRPLTARQTDDATLIPLPAGVDPNVPIEVRLRLGKPSVNSSSPELSLPIVYAPILKTSWKIQGDEQRVLVPGQGTVTPTDPVLRPTGFSWVARQGLGPLFIIGVLSLIGAWATKQSGYWRGFGLAVLALAVFVACGTALSAYSQTGAPSPLELDLPILASGENVALQVRNVPLWRVNFSWLGLLSAIAGVALAGYALAPTRESVTSFDTSKSTSEPPNDGTEAVSDATARGVTDSTSNGYSGLLPIAAVALIAVGVLLQRDGAAVFFGLLAASSLSVLFAPAAWDLLRQLPEALQQAAERRRAAKELKNKTGAAGEEETGTSASGGPVTAMLLFVVVTLGGFTDQSVAALPDGYQVADSITQEWNISHPDSRLVAGGKAILSGKPGDRFVLLRAPAVLTKFAGEGLRLTKNEVPGCGLAYVVSIPSTTAANADPDEDTATEEKVTTTQAAANEYAATFEYQLEAVSPTQGVPVLTSIAAVQVVDLRYEEPGWDVTSTSAIRIEVQDSDAQTQAKVLLGPNEASIVLKPQARDVTAEETKFFVEAHNLFLPGPGVVDGRHRLHVRTSQGQIRNLAVQIPPGLTVSSVDGPIGAWQFDADSGKLTLVIEPAQSQPFEVIIETQRGLGPLPQDLELAPLTVDKANGQVGLVAIAFGPDAQPEKAEPAMMSAVNLGDFDAGLVPEQATLHRVYRYGADGGQLALRVVPVQPEVRVISKQVLSLGDERIVLGINLVAEISRAGLFQLSFPLPDGLEVESLTGAALHHFSELTENGQRQVVLHLNGKTLGRQEFALTLVGAFNPASVDTWPLPRFELNEANRQTGELVVRPTTGIRLRTVSQQGISEADPRSVGGKAQGALAFRLLQRDWQLELGIEKLESWVTGQVLHEVAVREGQTRSTLLANFRVQNASIRELRVNLPISDPDENKTLRATGSTVSDLVRIDPNSDIWLVKFKRRVIGNIQFRIEYERRGDRADSGEPLSPASFPDARQLSYYFGVRAGGRLEVRPDDLLQGWQQIDWNIVPQTLREAGTRTAPALTFRSVRPAAALNIVAARHSVAEALKLRVTSGNLTTVLSPNGDQLTAVDLNMEVIQRSSLSIGLAADGELFSIFVNGESVNSVRKDNENAWQFYVLPGIDDRTATVRFVYSLKGSRLSRLNLASPKLNVPLENIRWNVMVPRGFKLSASDGNLELDRESQTDAYDRHSYLSKASGKRQEQAQQAAQLLEQANQLLQAGEQKKANWALNSVANQYALDAASNEDARVQLENLQTQQAIVGLNTRRQRLYLDNEHVDTSVLSNQQLKEAAAANPILQRDQLNFLPQQLSQLLRGNTTEDNAILQQIAGRLVQHQRTTEPAPQAIIISMPEEGSVYSFVRSVQVAENEPLNLELRIASNRALPYWQSGSVILAIVLCGVAFSLRKNDAS